MSKMKAKKYYRIAFELLSPLSVGSGMNDETDSDIIVDAKGNPMISGSSLAGVYRRVLEKDEAEKSFGKLLEGTNELDESSVITYDAVIDNTAHSEKSVYVGKRDMVALDEYKVAKAGAKFDFQILEPGVAMVTFIEINVAENQSPDDAIDKILSIWEKEGLSFGAKTKRGYGLTKATKILQACFDFEDGNSREKWLDFDLYNVADENWASYTQKQIESSNKYIDVRLGLRLLGGLSIREYSTKVGQADYEQMKLHNDELTAVIPGTSWAGAFRSQMKELGMKEVELRDVFGDAKGKKNKDTKDKGHQSKISFSESYIRDGVDVVYSRNAIDRFSGGTVDGALYTESTRYKGTTELVIKINRECLDTVRPYLAAALMDLAGGYMAIGGLTAIGRGLFEVTDCKVNGVVAEMDYMKLQEVLA